jgi:hypothetical protein
MWVPGLAILLERMWEMRLVIQLGVLLGHWLGKLWGQMWEIQLELV